MCIFRDCKNSVFSRGLCRGHYAQDREGKPLSPLRTKVVHSPGEVCRHEECDREAQVSHYCDTHYAQWKRLGFTKTIAYRTPPGQWSRNTKGYLRKKINGEEILQHRMVMEEILGRPLHPFENVHHKNGVRQDNRPSNLELWVTKQPKGQRPEDLVEWAREILELYS